MLAPPGVSLFTKFLSINIHLLVIRSFIVAQNSSRGSHGGVSFLILILILSQLPNLVGTVISWVSIPLWQEIYPINNINFLTWSGLLLSPGILPGTGDFWQSLILNIGKYNLCITKEGFIGLVSPLTLSGDLVVDLYVARYHLLCGKADVRDILALQVNAIFTE